MAIPDPVLQQRVERMLRRRVVEACPAKGGYTHARRFLLRLSDGGTIFAKLAADEQTAGWLREEHRVYSTVDGAFMPEMLGWEDDGERPLLILEDLSDATWPPPWDSLRIDAVLAALDALHSLGWDGPGFEERRPRFSGWWCVAEDPAPFLGLGIASEAWLERALPGLLESEARVELGGTALGHFDLRSDNLCVRGGRALFVDWSAACVGNPELDLGFFLPSLHAEGGPPPETLLPDAAPMAARASGFFASYAGLPVIPHAPRVRWVQRQQLEAALPWAVRANDLPDPG